MNAIFNLQVDCHRHTQAHNSKKDGSIKWAIIEMWPMLVKALPWLSQAEVMHVHLVEPKNREKKLVNIKTLNPKHQNKQISILRNSRPEFSESSWLLLDLA